MTHSLATKLKKAGFPQTTKWGKLLEKCTCGSEEYLNGSKLHAPASDCLIMEPILSDLIEACVPMSEDGNDFHLEFDHDGMWKASVCYNKRGEWEDWYEGTSPEEAVAMLWLALNKKDENKS